VPNRTPPRSIDDSRRELERLRHEIEQSREESELYEALCQQVRGSPAVSPDETSWKVAGELWWLWAFAAARPAVYAIQAGRGFAEAAAVLGADFDGVLVRDGWAPYRQIRAGGAPDVSRPLGAAVPRDR